MFANHSAENCIDALLQYCKKLAMENAALEVLASHTLRDPTARYTRIYAESQKTVAPEFAALSSLAREKNWELLHDKVTTELDKLNRRHPGFPP